MFTGIASHAGALGAALVVLIGAAILHDGPAAADPNQDDRFLALLEKKESPPSRMCLASSTRPTKCVANSMAACR